MEVRERTDMECRDCNQIKSNIRNVRGDIKFEPLALKKPNLASLNFDQPLYLCEECITLLEQTYGNIAARTAALGTTEHAIASESLSSTIALETPSFEQHIPNSSNAAVGTQSVASVIEGDVSSSQNSTLKRQRVEGDNQREANSGAVVKRFRSNELNELFSRPMPRPVRLQKLAEITNIPPEDLKDRELFTMWYQNRCAAESAERARLSQSRSNYSSSSNVSYSSVGNSFSQPLVQKSPPLQPPPPPQLLQRKTVLPPADKTRRLASAAIVDIPDDDRDSFYSNDNSSRGTTPPPAPPKPQAKKNDRQVPQKRTDDGNAHSNMSAPRRVRFFAPPSPSNSSSSSSSSRSNSNRVQGQVNKHVGG